LLGFEATVRDFGPHRFAPLKEPVSLPISPVA